MELELEPEPEPPSSWSRSRAKIERLHNTAYRNQCVLKNSCLHMRDRFLTIYYLIVTIRIRGRAQDLGGGEEQERGGGLLTPFNRT